MTSHAEFVLLTQQRYHAMRQRFGKLPFELGDFRSFVRELLGGEGGTVHCEYCNRLLNLGCLEFDHRLPVRQQGGSLGLENLAACCAPCNQQKGAMSAAAFVHLLNLVNDPYKFSEVDRTSLLGRLQSQLKLALREQQRRQERKRSCCA